MGVKKIFDSIFYIVCLIYIKSGSGYVHKILWSDYIGWKSVEWKLHFTWGCNWISILTFHICCMSLIKFSLWSLSSAVEHGCVMW